MAKPFGVVLLFFFSFGLCSSTESNSSIIDVLKYYSVIPDVIPLFQYTTPLEATYGDDLVVNQGNELIVAETQDPPNIEWTPEPGALYTVIMSDPDAPSPTRPIFREWLHWVIGNIEGSNLSSGDEVCPYMGPAPPRGTGLHRYVFVVYKQPGPIVFKPLDNVGKFDSRQFAKDHQLSAPVAVNFFHAQNH
eukprot:CAMPEP_0196652450 /NCGR_PEP_ID=MMETSP1086-20130531/1746_1 /TAXON_ID=77921 /ORGANISM="Cyanoptyche  gloeocystis , Strain SAG4.97" /LENGTH=190 /DNA_ID=CAMNT_0041983001 /DNA_START=99 /DNA_END=671 /DNA_ORIENTATION=+